MGKLIDLSSKRKRLDDAYPLDRSYGVYALLYHLHYVREMRFTRGDYDASLLLIDFDESLLEAKLTERQRRVLHYVFELDMTQQEAANLLNISQQAVSDHINSAIARVALLNKQKEGNCA